MPGLIPPLPDHTDNARCQGQVGGQFSPLYAMTSHSDRFSAGQWLSVEEVGDRLKGGALQRLQWYRYSNVMTSRVVVPRANGRV